MEADLSRFQPKQLEALSLITQRPDIKYAMIAGGIRSGKSIVCSTAEIFNAIRAPKTRHAVVHAFGNICRRNLFDFTFPEAMNYVYPGLYDHLDKIKNVHHTDGVITLLNDSEIHFFGLDDRSKLRGNQFSTIWINEANIGIDYETVTTAIGRLNEEKETVDGLTLPPKLVIDLNPTFTTSWEHAVWFEGVNPISGQPLPKRHKYAHYILNPRDNAPNLSKDYFDVFDTMTVEQRMNDEHGLWRPSNPDAMFSLNKIVRGPCPDRDELDDVVISVDHATTSKKTSDETGIIVAGRKDSVYFIMEDHTMKAKPDIWGQRAVDLYHKHRASYVLTETNQGGDLLDLNFASCEGGSTVKVLAQPAGRAGKIDRARPISALYDRGKVMHCQHFNDLETQMIQFDAPKYTGYDDRVDAMVYALAHLNVERPKGPNKVITGYKSGFYR